MVRRDEVDRSSSASRCSSPAGASPVSVSAGAPSSRPQASAERPVAQAGCQEPLRRKPARGPQPNVKPAASTDLQPESRAGHVAAKAMPAVSQSGDHAAGLGGVGGAARVQGDERNTRGPSAPSGSGQRGSYKPRAKASAAQRASEGVVVATSRRDEQRDGSEGFLRWARRGRKDARGHGRQDRSHSPRSSADDRQSAPIATSTVGRGQAIPGAPLPCPAGSDLAGVTSCGRHGGG